MHICGFPSALGTGKEGHNCDTLQCWELDPPTGSTAYSMKQQKGQGPEQAKCFSSSLPEPCASLHSPTPPPGVNDARQVGSERFSSRGHNQLVAFCQVKPQHSTCERKFHTGHTRKAEHGNRSSASSGHSKPNRKGFYGSH